MTETTEGLTIRYLTIKQVEQATRLTELLTDWRPSGWLADEQDDQEDD